MAEMPASAPRAPLQLDCDYLVVGAGAMGMAFADVLAQEAEAGTTIIMVDRRAAPGGHWCDAYSFVKLHQPAYFYGVASEDLGPGGSYLADGAEILNYYEKVMAKLRRGGRLRFYSMCEYERPAAPPRAGATQRFRSVVSRGLHYEVAVRRRVVDATYLEASIPSLRAPCYKVSPEVALVPVNGLSRVREPHPGYVVIGGGKTGMDAVLFLLQQGVGTGDITWVVPNDMWMQRREALDPHTYNMTMMPLLLRMLSEARDTRSLFRAMEASGFLHRLDPSVWPTRFPCPTVSAAELKQLRSITKVVRLGRVLEVGPSEILLERGTIPTDAGALHVDCTSNGLTPKPPVPVFQTGHIVLQSLHMCQQVFSAALTAHVECAFRSDDERNAVCTPVPHPVEARDMLRCLHIQVRSGASYPAHLVRWLDRCRLLPLTGRQSAWFRVRRLVRALPALLRLKQAARNLRRMCLEEFGEDAFAQWPSRAKL